MIKIPDEPFRPPTRGHCPPSPSRRSLVKAVVWTLGIQAALALTLACFHCGLNWDAFMSTGVVQVELVAPADEPDDKDAEEPEGAQELAPVVPFTPLIQIVETPDQETWEIPPIEEVRIEEPVDLVRVDDTVDVSDWGELIEEPAVKSPAPRPQKKAVEKDKSQKKKVEVAKDQGAPAQEDIPARYRNAPLPPYPHSARAQGRDGVVHLLVSVDAQGHPTKVSLAKSSGVESLDRAAIQWVSKNWTFYPATRHGVAIASNIITPIRFQLD